MISVYRQISLGCGSCDGLEEYLFEVHSMQVTPTAVLGRKRAGFLRERPTPFDFENGEGPRLNCALNALNTVSWIKTERRGQCLPVKVPALDADRAGARDSKPSRGTFSEYCREITGKSGGKWGGPKSGEPRY